MYKHSDIFQKGYQATMGILLFSISTHVRKFSASLLSDLKKSWHFKVVAARRYSPTLNAASKIFNITYQFLVSNFSIFT